jgi:hypothetical protein
MNIIPLEASTTCNCLSLTISNNMADEEMSEVRVTQGPEMRCFSRASSYSLI